MRMRLELIPLPVSDLDRSIAFYADKLGFKKDFDVQPSEGVRIVQLTPEGSVVRSVLGQSAMCTRENPAVSEACTWLWRTSPTHVPSLSAEAYKSAKSGTSAAASREQTSPILTATHLNCSRCRGAGARRTRSLLTPRRLGAG
jgi:predicted enzyme related to lactoylglutathione lyase